MRSKIKYGFSLLEVSIVLVVIGLCVGGVVAGRHLLRANDLQAAATEAQHYITAMHNFRDKYHSLPGDMPNATDVWGAADPTPATCYTTVATDKRTCNGTGDGRIRAASANGEPYRFWQHLANAGLISGNFTGVRGTNSWDHDIGKNCPQSVLSGGGYGIEYVRTTDGAGQYFPGYSGHTFFFGAETNDYPGSLLTPQELYQFDSKVDDGKPGTGQVRTLMNTATSAPGCATTDSASTAIYAATSNIPCWTMINAGF